MSPLMWGKQMGHLLTKLIFPLPGYKVHCVVVFFSVFCLVAAFAFLPVSLVCLDKWVCLVADGHSDWTSAHAHTHPHSFPFSLASSARGHLLQPVNRCALLINSAGALNLLLFRCLCYPSPHLACFLFPLFVLLTRCIVSPNSEPKNMHIIHLFPDASQSVSSTQPLPSDSFPH